MTLKIIQGLVRLGSPGVDSKTQDLRAQSQNAVRALISDPVLSTEAVVTTVRGAPRVGQQFERIKTFEEAKHTANKVADKVRESDEALDVHSGLDSVSERGEARRYFE